MELRQLEPSHDSVGWRALALRSPGASSAGPDGGATRNGPEAGTDDESARLRGLLDGLEAVVWEAGPDGRIRFVNRRAEELFGYDIGRWVADPDFWLGIVHPDDRQWATAHRLRCLHDGRDGQLEYRVVAIDGRVIWVSEAVRVARDHHGRVEALRGVLWNIGRRKKVERQLYTARRELTQRLTDTSLLHELCLRLWDTPEPGPLLGEILAETAAIQGAEMGLLRLYDPAAGELKIAASIGLPEDYVERYQRASLGTVVCGLAIERKRPIAIDDFETNPIAGPYREPARVGGYRAAHTTPLISRHGTPLGTIVTFFRDPYRLPERQARLAESFAHQAADFIENARLQRALRESVGRKDDALATLAHELRSPVAVILNTMYTLRPGDSGSASFEETRDLITRQAQRMARLVDDLLETARFARGEVKLYPVAVNLETVVNQAARVVQPLIQTKGHDVTFRLPAEAVLLEADPDRLEQILINLMTNAARYTAPGGRISVECERDGNLVEICIRDTGIGIAPDMLTRIFDPFVQGVPETGSPPDGLGLGLALVKGLVERHGGTVTCTSDGPGRGSEFVVSLPVGQPGAAATPLETPVAPSGPRPVRVLVVDDQPDATQSLAKLLKLWGYETATAYDGPKALEAAQACPPDIALLDIGLPGMRGEEVARTLRERHGSAMKIVALTGFGPRSRESEPPDSDFDAYLIKPVTLETLLKLLESPNLS